MKTIGIIGAMEEEVKFIKEHLDIITAKNIVGLDFFMGKMGKNNVVLVRSGIGKVNAAICTQVLISLYAVDYIVNIGVAGGVSDQLNIGDIVISTEAMHHDFDTTIFGDEPGFIPRMQTSIFKADDFLIKLATESIENIQNINIFTGRIVSGDKFVSDIAEKNKIKKTFSPLCVDMESASIAQTCNLNKIPFVIIRSISDNSDEGTVQNYEEFFVQSAKNASIFLQSIIEKI